MPGGNKEMGNERDCVENYQPWFTLFTTKGQDNLCVVRVCSMQYFLKVVV